jgi:hypothetical protein
MPLYPSKVLRAKELAPIPCSSVVFYLRLTFGVLQGVRSALGTFQPPLCGQFLPNG